MPQTQGKSEPQEGCESTPEQSQQYLIIHLFTIKGILIIFITIKGKLEAIMLFEIYIRF